MVRAGEEPVPGRQYDKALEAFGSLLEARPEDLPSRPKPCSGPEFASITWASGEKPRSCSESWSRTIPRDQRVPEALYWIGKSYSKLGDRERAVKTFQKILTRHPDSEWADDALFLTGNIYREAGDMKKALTFYGRLRRGISGQQVRGQLDLVDGLVALQDAGNTGRRTGSSRN